VHYAAALIEAAVIAKVMLIGQIAGLGKRFESEPLIVTVPVKALLYALLVALFGLLEHIIEGVVHGNDWAGIVHAFLSIGIYEILARTLMVIFTFIPFFALWELNRVLGEGKLYALFFSEQGIVENSKGDADTIELSLEFDRNPMALMNHMTRWGARRRRKLQYGLCRCLPPFLPRSITKVSATRPKAERQYRSPTGT
jgi:hypothetical protein